MDQREEDHRARLDEQRASEDHARTHAIRECSGDEPGEERGRRSGRSHQARNAQRDTANVVQVDDHERDHDPVAEGVCEPAYLKDPDVPRQPRVQAAKVGPHKASLTPTTRL